MSHAPADDSALTARVLSLMVIIICSLCGVMYPLYLVSKNNDVRSTEWYATLKTASTGLVLGVAFLHLLDDADLALKQESDYPFASFGALVGVVMVTAMEQLVAISLGGATADGSLEAGLKSSSCNSSACGHTSSYQNGSGAGGDVAAGSGAASSDLSKAPAKPLTSLSNAQNHLAVLPLLKEGSVGETPDNLPARMEIFFLEVSISLHSIVLGFGLGIMTSTSAVVSLTIALVFHQFFEGIALGMAAAKPELDQQVRAGAVAIFTLSLPLGGLVGMLVASGVSTDTPASHWLLGGCNAVAAGMLMQIGFMHFLQEDFGCINHHHEHQHQAPVPHMPMAPEAPGLVHKKLAALAAGVGCMSVLAIWG